MNSRIMHNNVHANSSLGFLTLLVLSGFQVFKRNHKADRKKKNSHIENIYIVQQGNICYHVQKHKLKDQTLQKK